MIILMPVKKIMLIETESDYGVVNSLSYSMADAFEKQHRDVLLLGSDQIDHFEKYFLQFEPDFTFSFNVAPLFFGNNIPFFDFFQSPHFSYFLDHPINLFPYYQISQSKHLFISCVDPNTIHFLTEKIKFDKERVFWLPHCLDHLEFQPDIPKEFDVAIGATFDDPKIISNEWSKVLEPFIVQIMEKMIEFITESDYQLNAIDALHYSLNNMGISLAPQDVREFEKVLYQQVDIFTRLKKKNELLKIFGDFPVRCYGKIPPPHIQSLAPQWTFCGPLLSKDLNKEIAKSRIQLHFHHNLHHAAHERVLRGLFSKSLVLGEWSMFFEDAFEDCISLFHLSNAKNEGKEKILELLNNKPLFDEKVSLGYQKGLENFTVESRAMQVLEIMDYFHDQKELESIIPPSVPSTTP